MTSANGQILIITQGSKVWEERAYWAAPYFALHLDDADDPERPLLIHCETLEDAQHKGGIIFDSQFNRLDLS